MPRHCTRCGSPGPFYVGEQVRYWCIPCEQAQSRHYYALVKARLVARLQARLNAGRPLTQREERTLLRATCPPGCKICSYCRQPRALGWFAPWSWSKDGRRSQCRQCCKELTAFYAHTRKGKEQHP